MNDRDHSRELDRMTAAYSRRSAEPRSSQWTMLVRDERERIYRRLLDAVAPAPVDQLLLIELGCGSGGELERMISLGFDPCRLSGVDLLPDRVKAARERLPSEVQVDAGDATRTGLPSGSFDVVFLSTVFTSILDDEVQARFADEAWRLLRPGGSVLWYDFVVDNPRNPDVRGVPVARIRTLFPDAEATFQSATVLPPLGRAVARLGVLGPPTYKALSCIPLLRTHVVGMLRKPVESPA
jgi:SAM-dependent methyltransferase